MEAFRGRKMDCGSAGDGDVPPIVTRCVERVWGEKGDEFRNRNGDSGRTVCGLKLLELAQAAGMQEYATVAMAVKRYGRRLRTDAGAQRGK
jgi:hypothetical protein